MSSIWNKVAVLGLTAVLSAPVLAADDIAAKGAQDAQANAMSSQDTSGALSQENKEVKETKEKGSKHKHKAHHHKGAKEKEGVKEGSTDKTVGTEGSAGTPSNTMSSN